MPERGIAKRRHEDILTIEEIEGIVGAVAACGIRKVRVTGGEPLMRKGIIDICRRVSETPGIEELCLTSNGILLPEFAVKLKDAGVNRLNISLDSLDPNTYREITRNGNLADALTGFDAALKAGFDAIKINAVLIGGVNDNEILELLELTRQHNANVRFIEIMPVGQCAGWAKDRFISSSIVLEVAPQLNEVGTDGVAKLYKLPGGQGTVGLISPISSHFCPTCNRIRVTADGLLKPCLHSPEEINLRGLHGKELENTIRKAIRHKPKKHILNTGSPSAVGRNMNTIGG